jgi:hypothetical protein
VECHYTVFAVRFVICNTQRLYNNMADTSKAQTVLSVLTLPIIAFTVVASYYTAYKKGEFVWFSYHPVSMIVAFVGLASYGILKKKVGGYVNTQIHGYCMFVGALLCVFGFYVIYTNKEMNNKPHFVTTHGQVGAVLFLAYCISAVGGYIGLNPDNGFFKTDKNVRFSHKISGRILILLAWITCFLGFATMESNSTKQLMFVLPLVALSYFTLL